MQQFFLPTVSAEKEEVILSGENYRHIVKVLRMKIGDKILLFNGLGSQFQAKITEIDNEKIVALIEKESSIITEPPIKITILQGIPKKDKMELIVQKGTELGMFSLIPINSKRAVVKMDQKKSLSRQDRWQKIALEASKQCGRAFIPEIKKVTSLKEALANLNVDLLIFPWENEKEISLKDTLRNFSKNRITSAAICIGPEGGWSSEEVLLAKTYGAKLVSLGPRILRTETAGIAALTMLLYELGDLGG